jgi:hypothetical protein
MSSTDKVWWMCGLLTGIVYRELGTLVGAVVTVTLISIVITYMDNKAGKE